MAKVSFSVNILWVQLEIKRMFSRLNYVHIHRNTTLCIPNYRPDSAHPKSESEKTYVSASQDRDVIGGTVSNSSSPIVLHIESCAS